VKSHPPHHRSARRPGLSLLEVLLALAIFIIALAAIGTLIGGANDRGAEARLFNTAARLAQSKLAEFEAGVSSFNETSGSFPAPDDAWQWTAQADLQTSNLYLVTVTVSRDLGGRRFEFSLGQMMLDPSLKGSATKASRPAADTSGEVP
jgi:type II secretory pathway pseudopilin PulG